MLPKVLPQYLVKEALRYANHERAPRPLVDADTQFLLESVSFFRLQFAVYLCSPVSQVPLSSCPIAFSRICNALSLLLLAAPRAHNNKAAWLSTGVSRRSVDPQPVRYLKRE